MRDGFLARNERLHDEAIASAGLSDFGDPVYRDGLRTLLAARDASGVDYPDDGAAVLAGMRQTLAARLATIERLKHAGPVPAMRAPIFILGLPRTGTTALQRLLMGDPQFQGLEYWLGESPRPRPPRDTWAQDLDFVRCRAALDGLAEIAPLVAAMHPMAADQGEECRLVMEQSFGHSSFSLVSPIPDYQRWLFAADLAPHYAHYRRVLELIGATEPDKTWVLKCPHHAPQVDSLLKVFPDARIVFMHRPVEEIAGSVARLAEAFLTLLEGPGIDMAARARMIVDNLDLTLRRLLAVRAANPANFHDLTMDDFVADPVRAVATVHRRFGLPLDDDRRAAVARWVAAHRTRGAAVQTALPYGLNRDALGERFAYYQG